MKFIEPKGILQNLNTQMTRARGIILNKIWHVKVTQMTHTLFQRPSNVIWTFWTLVDVETTLCAGWKLFLARVVGYRAR